MTDDQIPTLTPDPSTEDYWDKERTYTARNLAWALAVVDGVVDPDWWANKSDAQRDWAARIVAALEQG